MDLGTVTASVVVLLLSAVWYGLQIMALRDLRRRPRVRGDNKVLWALAILCLPYVGALAYLISGPTSFLPRDEVRSESQPARRSARRHFPAVPTLQPTTLEPSAEPADPFRTPGTPDARRPASRPSPTVNLPRHATTRPQPKTTPRAVTRPKVTPSTMTLPLMDDPDDWDGVKTLPPLPVFPGEEHPQDDQRRELL